MLTWLAESDFLKILGLDVVEMLESRHLQIVPNRSQKLAEVHVLQDLAQPLDTSIIAHFVLYTQILTPPTNRFLGIELIVRGCLILIVVIIIIYLQTGS